MAFQCLTGVPPFRGASDREILLAHRQDRPPAPSAINSRLSGGVDDALSAVTECVPQPEAQTGRILAAVGCGSLLPGVDSLLLRQAEPGPR